MNLLSSSAARTLLVACLLPAALAACNNGTDDPTATPASVSGRCQVTSFVDKSLDRTALFSALTFDLTASGTLRINHGGTTLTTGSWQLVQDGGREKLVLTYALAADDLSELSEDWVVASKTPARLELTNTSGGNGGTKSLVLTKR